MRHFLVNFVLFGTPDCQVKYLVKFLAINRNWNGIWRTNCDFMEVSIRPPVIESSVKSLFIMVGKH